MELRGHLDLLLLSALAAVGPAHGYTVITALRQRTDDASDLPEGTVYPALHRAGARRAGGQRVEHRGGAGDAGCTD